MKTLNVAVNELEPQVRFVVKELLAHGKEITMVMEGDLRNDPLVDFDDDYSIQICVDGSYALTHGEGDELDYLVESDNFADILEALNV